MRSVLMTYVAGAMLLCTASRADVPLKSQKEYQGLVGTGVKPTPVIRVGVAHTAAGSRIKEQPATASEEDDSTADGDPFPDAVLVGNDRTFWCTGVLLDRTHVLTAAHCASATRVGFGNTAATAIQDRVTSRRIHPVLDVAVLALAVPSDVRIHARRTAGQDTPPLGTIRIIGFGVTDQLRLTGFGTKRQLDLGIDGWGCTGARRDVSGCNVDRELLIRAGYGNDTCLGDSGGPVFELVDDSWRLIAITSRGMRPTKVICGEGGIYVRVDRIDAWLKEDK